MVSKFGPDELKVNINGRTLTVEGKQEVKEDSSYTCRRSWRRADRIQPYRLASAGHQLPKLKAAICSGSHYAFDFHPEP
ncbi:hypothetical protein COOONC_17223 [Cooperia oncophora]